LDVAVEGWELAGSRGYNLLRGPALTQAKRFCRTHADALNRAELGFIRKSLSARRRRLSIQGMVILVAFSAVFFALEAAIDRWALAKINGLGGRVRDSRDLKGIIVDLPSSVSPKEAHIYLKKIRNRKLLHIEPDSNAAPQLSDLDMIIDLFPSATLSLKALDVTELPHLARLTKLESLNLSYTFIKGLDGLDRLTGLKSLDIGYITLTNVLSVAPLTRLTSLNISGAGFSDLRGLERLISLESFTAEHSNLPTFPVSGKLPALKILDLAHSKAITHLPDLESFPALRSLDIHDSSLNKLSGLEKLTELEILDVSETRINELPGLASLTGLVDLDISRTDVTDLPGVTNLRSLKKLKVKNSRVPDELLTEITNHLPNVTITGD